MSFITKMKESDCMQYQIFEHIIKTEEDEVKTYGVLLVVNGNEAVRVYDVSTDYYAVSKLVDSINAIKLNPFRLGDILEYFFNNN